MERGIVEHSQVTVHAPGRTGARLVHHFAGGRYDEQLGIGLAEIEDGDGGLAQLIPPTDAIMMVTPASSSILAAASVRPSSVMMVPIRDSGRTTLRG
ncbi:hypothetical protein D3C86_2018950 [compost metagenome]